jgi:hypothetical protein
MKISPFEFQMMAKDNPEHMLNRIGDPFCTFKKNRDPDRNQRPGYKGMGVRFIHRQKHFWNALVHR